MRLSLDDEQRIMSVFVGFYLGHLNIWICQSLKCIFLWFCSFLFYMHAYTLFYVHIYMSRCARNTSKCVKTHIQILMYVNAWTNVDMGWFSVIKLFILWNWIKRLKNGVAFLTEDETVIIIYFLLVLFSSCFFLFYNISFVQT